MFQIKGFDGSGSDIRQVRVERGLHRQKIGWGAEGWRDGAWSEPWSACAVACSLPNFNTMAPINSLGGTVQFRLSHIILGQALELSELGR